jgi:hypothetical protein
MVLTMVLLSSYLEISGGAVRPGSDAIQRDGNKVPSRKTDHPVHRLSGWRFHFRSGIRNQHCLQTSVQILNGVASPPSDHPIRSQGGIEKNIALE